MMICKHRSFGMTDTGEEAVAYTMTNSKGHSVTVLNYGGIIQSIMVPDKEGNLANVVMGYNDIEGYIEHAPHFGCITGRTAGRISGGGFVIDGTRYDLISGDNGVNLHGGPVGLDRRIWHVAEVVADDHIELALSYTSPAMDQGFPGEVDMVVSYRFDEEDALTITYRGTTDAATILTLTNHSYFNLSGDLSTDILSHEMRLPADRVVVIDKDSVPVRIEDVSGGAFDFRKPKAIGRDIGADDENLKNGAGYDHPFVLNKEDGETLELFHKPSGRKMTVTTSEQCVVCYTGNFLGEVPYVFDGQKVVDRGAVCLETQYYPDAINASFIPERILRPGEAYLEETTFRFTAE